MIKKMSSLLLPILFISCVTTSVDKTQDLTVQEESQVIEAEEVGTSEHQEVSRAEPIDKCPLSNPDNYFTNLITDESIALPDLTHKVLGNMNPVSSDDQGMYKIYSFDIDDPNAVIAFGQETLLIQSIDWINISGPGFPSPLQIGMSMEEVVQSLIEVYGEPDYISEPGTRPLDYYGWSNISSNFVIGFSPDSNNLFSIEF